MKVSTTNDNGRNAFAKNLMAPILFYLKADSSLVSDDEKCSECDHNVMVHKVHYDLENVVTCIQIYLTPFDTGSVNSGANFI